MTAVVTLKPGQTGRHYRLPTAADYEAVRQAQERVARILDEWEQGGLQGLCPVPDEPLPLMSGTFNVPLYGINRWGDLFTARQKAALVELGQLLSDVLSEGESCATSLLVGRMSDFLVSLARWKPDAECPVQALARQALPMTWDFAEANPWTEATGSITSQANRMADAVKSVGIPPRNVGQLLTADATDHPLPDYSAKHLVHRSSILFCRAVCRPVGFLLCLAQTCYSKPLVTSFHVQFREWSNPQEFRAM